MMLGLPSHIVARLTAAELNEYKQQLLQQRQKKPQTAILLAIGLGSFGIHKFYQGRWQSGIGYLLFSWTLLPLLFSLIDIFFIPGQIKWDNRYAALHLLSTTHPELRSKLAGATSTRQALTRLEIVLKLVLGTIFIWLAYVMVATYLEHYRPTRSWHGIPYHYRTAPKSFYQASIPRAKRSY